MLSSNDKTTGGSITGTSADKKRTSAVMFSVANDGGTQAVVTYEEKKQ